jgi:hypothetical protein
MFISFGDDIAARSLKCLKYWCRNPDDASSTQLIDLIGEPCGHHTLDASYRFLLTNINEILAEAPRQAAAFLEQVMREN